MLRNNIMNMFASDDGLMFLDPPDFFDQHIIGVSENDHCNMVITYDGTGIINHLIHDGLSYEDAVEHFDFNIAGTKIQHISPIFVWRIYD